MTDPTASNPTATPDPDLRSDPKIMGKPVIMSDARILNLNSGFQHKYLCDGPTFSAGSACAYKCRYCYVEAIIGNKPFIATLLGNNAFQEVVIRRRDAVGRLRRELRTANGKLKFKGGDCEVARRAGQPMVCYGSPLVDIAATKELAEETVEMMHVLLEDTDWDVRLLSKSPLINGIAESLTNEQKQRVIFGLSVGTLDDALARAIEPTCPSPSERIKAHHWLQNNGYRTFAMLCPILPQPLEGFVGQAMTAIRPDQCEHVWAEVLNVRGESMKQTLAALEKSQLAQAADELRSICGPGRGDAWEDYARKTFLALAEVTPRNDAGPKLRFLQYVNKDSEGWWRERLDQGAVVLGRSNRRKAAVPGEHSESSSTSSCVAHVSNASADLNAQEVVSLLEEAADLSKAAGRVADAASKLAEKIAHQLIRFTTSPKPHDSLMPERVGIQSKKTPDPKRSEGAKRAWIKIRKKRAAMAARTHPAA